MTQEEYILLYQKYCEGRCTPEEESALFTGHEEFQLENHSWDEKTMGNEENSKRAVWLHLKKRVQPKRKWFYISASVAAMLVIVIGYFSISQNNPPIRTTASESKPVNALNTKYADLDTVGNKAILTLANGLTIKLDSLKVGSTTTIGNLNINKADEGKLSYSVNPSTTRSPITENNTLTTPKGGQYEMVLSDGTKVFLNAVSSLRFPTAFKGKERIVELIGEGYFEVAKNAEMPFKVKVGDMTVAVLGTHFNIMAYEGEKWIKTTLLEGSVKLSSGSTSTMLKPGEQGRLSNTGTIQVVQVKTDEEVAWRNGFFAFNNANIETIMRELARWYDVEVQFKGSFTDDQFVGKIPRSSTLSEVLRMLQLTGVHFSMEGKKLIVMP